MKPIKKISLSKLNETQLDKKQQQLIFGGGYSCKCGSCNTNSGPQTATNSEYNKASGITGTGDGSGSGTIICTCYSYEISSENLRG